MSLPADTKKWISNLVKRYGIKSILNYLKQVSELKVCLIGDSIIDEYIFTEALGKSSKDPLLAFQIKDKISIPGGIMAVARHIDGLNAKSTVFTALNDRDSLFLEAFFSSNTKLEMLKKASITTTRKSRYVDKASSHRVFETYEMGDSEISPDFLTTLNSNSQKLKDANIVMVFDYGHSLIDDSIVNYLRDFRGKASVNAQRNAGNRGLNSISKYRGFPTMYMNGGEVTAEMRQRSLDMPSLLKALLAELEAEQIFATNGSGGLIYRNSKDELLIAPAFAPRIVDRTGAGDALMTLSSLMLSVGAPVDISAFYGNLAGAYVIQAIGNELTFSLSELNTEAEIALSLKGESLG
jgi:bifunctional ADP-heptose synthase (sugar kinase/adenylyltransferase)